MGLQATIQNAANAAFNALGDISQELTLRRKGTGGQYDPVTGRYNGTSSSIDYPCRGVLLNFNFKDAGIAYRAGNNGALLLTGDKKALIEAASLKVVPSTCDMLIANGTEYVITAIKETKPGTMCVIYELQVKLA